jgi:hypothetical protein
MRFLLLVPFLIACKGGESDDQDTGSAPSGIARIEVLPSAMLLTESGASQEVTVVAYDGEDEVMEGLAFTLSSEDPDVSVSGNTITAVSDVGSAQVRVQVGEVVESILVIIAEPVEEAVLVPDSAVRILELLDEGPWRPGSRYTVSLDGIEVAMGDIVIASQSAPIIGRVTEIDGDQVTLTIVVPEEAFEKLVIYEEWTGDQLKLELKDSAKDFFDLEELEDGTFSLTTKERKSMELTSGEIDGWECTGNISANDLKYDTTFTYDMTGLTKVFDYDGGLNKLSLNGVFQMTAEVKWTFATSLKGSFGCSVYPWTVKTRAGGFVSVFYGLDVDFGPAFLIKADMTPAELSIRGIYHQTNELNVGVDCTSGTCQWLMEGLIPDGEFSFEYDSPDISEDWKFGLDIRLFANALLVTRPQFPDEDYVPDWADGLLTVFGDWRELLKAVEFKILQLSFGLSEQLDLARQDVQARNLTYASEEVLSLFASAKLPFWDWVEKHCPLTQCMVLGVAMPNLSVEWNTEITRSPRGIQTEQAFSIDSQEIAVGEPVTVTVRLDQKTVNWGVGSFGFYNVNEVVIYEFDDSADAADTMTERARIPATKDQTTFEWEWIPTTQDLENAPVFTAFIDPKWPPFELEIKKDSRLTNGCVPSYLGRIVLRNNEGITVVGPGGSVNDSEEVSFIGDLGNGETVVILDAGGGLTLPAFTGNGRTYGGGAPINASGQTTVRERVSNKYLTRIWNLDETGITTGRSWDGDFDSAQFWQDINSSGQVALVGLTDDSENVSLFKWTGSQLQTIGVYDGYTSVRPQISDSGRVVYRGDNDQLLVNDGNGSTTIHSGPVSRHPGISATGDRLAWITTGSIESLNFAFEKNGNYETFVLSTTPNGFSNLDEENRQGVAHIPGVCDAGASVVVFLATKNGIEGVHVATLNDSADTGVPSLAGIQTLVESGDVIDGETLGDFSLFDPVSPNGTIVVKSGSDTFILFSPEWPL